MRHPESIRGALGKLYWMALTRPHEERRQKSRERAIWRLEYMLKRANERYCHV